jgi:hypothetical protein
VNASTSAVGIPATPTPAPEPLVRHCREVIEHAGAFALALAEQGPGVQRVLARFGLGEFAAALADAVMTLDHHTNYLGGPPAPAPTGLPNGPLSGVY